VHFHDIASELHVGAPNLRTLMSRTQRLCCAWARRPGKRVLSGIPLWLLTAIVDSDEAHHSFVRRSRNALVITETELRLIAAPAITGLSSKPKNG
jgi:hypothetical protein